MKYGILGLGILCLIGAWTALKGIRASREQLLGMAKVIGTKNPTAARVVCWVAFIPLFFGGLGLLVGGGVIVYKAIDEVSTPEVTRVENVVRDGLKEKTGRVPDKVSLREQGGKYTGTASFGAETWDVTATVGSSEVKWEARERVPGGGRP
jgi:hypothetical protein